MSLCLLPTTLLALIIACGLFPCSNSAAQTTALKPRIVILTDIGTSDIEPDDHESMVRLLCYADRFEIEALIAGSGWNTSKGAYPESWIHILQGTLDAYEKDAPNLMRRSGQNHFQDDESTQTLGYWPSPAYLRSRTMLGSPKLGFDKLGEDNDSAGSDFLIKLADENDPRPIWVCVWGGANTFAQAVWRVQKSRNPEQLKTFLHKFRLYTITDQDKDWGREVPFEISSHQWLRRVFCDDLIFLWDESAWLFQNETGKANWSRYATDIQGHGNLGREYPSFKWGVEGDTPSFLYVMPNGLNQPEHPESGGWGGCFTRGIGPDGKTSAYVNQPGSTANPLSQKYEEHFYPAIYNDFVARIHWAEFGSGNHNPIVVLNGDRSLNPIEISCETEASITLDASSSTDPDRDAVRFSWWVSPEAGSEPAPVVFSSTNTARTEVKIPASCAGKSIQVICEVTDNGSPELSSYRRIVMHPKNWPQ